ncbi:MAG TPA: DUF5683 domain-containing protein [Gemmatimonadaceae bacterium]|nr:DUF5683 domain-containing protein [Gemmatimonadaceae bacterium]
MGGVRRQVWGVLVGILAAAPWTTVAAMPPVDGGGATAGVQLAARDWFGRPAVAGPERRWQQDKNPTVAMVSSFLIPGLGQLYNEREFWSLVAASVHFYFIGDIVVEQRLTNRYNTLKNVPVDSLDAAAVAARKEAEVLYLLHRDNRIQSTWLLGLTLILSGLQSYVDAHLFHFEATAPLQLEPSFGAVQGGVLRLRF